jgi:hypothetical protein
MNFFFCSYLEKKNSRKKVFGKNFKKISREKSSGVISKKKEVSEIFRKKILEKKFPTFVFGPYSKPHRGAKNKTK